MDFFKNKKKILLFEKKPEQPLEEDKIYPNIEEVYESQNSAFNFTNINKFEKKSDLIVNYVYKKRIQEKYSYSENLFRENVLLNQEDKRFFKNGERLSYDPWLFENSKVDWPDFVEYIYYTKLTPTGSLVQYSYLANVYLNLAFKNQDFAPMLRLTYYPIYNLMAKSKRNIDVSDIKTHFINKEFINSLGNLEFFLKEEGVILRDFDLSKIKYKKIKRDEEQPTSVRYKDFYDLIPVCSVPCNILGNNINLSNYLNLEKLLMSEICFHENKCHDSWCKTHNKDFTENLRQRTVDHNLFLKLYDFDKNQIFKVINQ